MRVIFLCREVNRSTGEVAVYQIGNVHGANEECQLLFELDLRQRMNPELQYFIMDSKEYLANKERIETLLKVKNIDRKILKSLHVVHV